MDKNSLIIKCGGNIKQVPHESILYIKSEDKYTSIFTIENLKCITNISMKQLEEKLPPEQFIRVHHNSIVNTGYLSTVDEDGNVTMTGGTKLKVSRRKLGHLKNVFDAFSLK